MDTSTSRGSNSTSRIKKRRPHGFSHACANLPVPEAEPLLSRIGWWRSNRIKHLTKLKYINLEKSTSPIIWMILKGFNRYTLVIWSASPEFLPNKHLPLRYSHFQDPVVLADSPGAGNPRPPRDIRTPVRRRFNRITGKAILTPEVILISCTEGRDLRAQISDFESTGMGPHYVISRNGELVNFVEACWQEFAISKMEPERGESLEWCKT